MLEPNKFRHVAIPRLVPGMGVKFLWQYLAKPITFRKTTPPAHGPTPEPSRQTVASIPFDREPAPTGEEQSAQDPPLPRINELIATIRCDQARWNLFRPDNRSQSGSNSPGTGRKRSPAPAPLAAAGDRSWRKQGHPPQLVQHPHQRRGCSASRNQVRGGDWCCRRPHSLAAHESRQPASTGIHDRAQDSAHQDVQRLCSPEAPREPAAAGHRQWRGPSTKAGQTLNRITGARPCSASHPSQ